VLAAAVLVLVPLTVYAAFGGGLDQPWQNLVVGGPPAQDGGYGADAGDPGAVSAAPGRQPAGSQLSGQPVDVADATLALGAWRAGPAGSPQCPSGNVAFNAGVAQVSGAPILRIRQSARIDVDQDGTDEVAIVLSCQDSQAGTYQAIVLKAVRGTWTTMGQLARSGPNGDDILAVAPAPAGRISLTVGDVIPCCGTPRALELTQVRTFAWNHVGFAQVAGPTTFVADRSAANLDVTAPPVRFSGLTAGKSTGTLTVTIRNLGPRDAKQISVAVLPDQPLAPAAGGDWARCVTLDGTNRALVCPVGDLAVGATATLRLPLTAEFGGQSITLQPRLGQEKYDALRVASVSA
jgi:hypothetical protein